MRREVAVAAAIAVLAMGTTTAGAAEDRAFESGRHSAVELVRKVDPGPVEAEERNRDVSVPESGDGVVAVSDPTREGPDLTLTLPRTVRSAEAARSGDAATFAATNHQVVVRPRGESGDTGDVSIYVVIADAEAPDSYDFELGTRDGVRPVLHDSGAVELLTVDGEPVGVIDPPWAVDARGAEPSARYSLDGQTLTLHVDHSGATYPVVADPVYTNNCGTATCSSYWSRTATDTAAYLSGLITLPPAWTYMCSYIPISDPHAVFACGQAITPPWIFQLQVNITQASQHNKCIKLTRVRHVGTLNWISTNDGTYCHNV